MEETVGTLNLKIARLEQKLQLLQKQRLLSKPYPDHLAHLILQDFQACAQLQNLLENQARKSSSELVLNFPEVTNSLQPKSPHILRILPSKATLELPGS